MTGITIGAAEVSAITYQDQRVVTFAMIDKVHGRPKGTAGRSFRENRDRFVLDQDYFVLTGDEIRRQSIAGAFAARTRKGTLLTRRGYLKVVKSQNDDLAWIVFDDMIDRYFALTVDEKRTLEAAPAEPSLLADLSAKTEAVAQGLQAVVKSEASSVRSGVIGEMRDLIAKPLGQMQDYQQLRADATYKRDIRMIEGIDKLVALLEPIVDLAKIAADPGTIVPSDWVTARGIFSLTNAPHSRALSARVVTSLAAYAIEVDRQGDVRSPPYDRTQRLYRAALVRAWFKDRGRRMIEDHLAKHAALLGSLV